MARQAWGSIGYFVQNSKITKKQYHAILKCGEDVMLGSYVITKLGGVVLIEDLRKEIIRDAIETLGPQVENIQDALSNDEAMKYFDHCYEFGMERAKGIEYVVS